MTDARNALAQQLQGSGYDPVASGQMAIQQIYQTVQQQATAMSYFDVFWFFSMAAFFVLPLVFLMRRSVAGQSDHVAVE